MTLSDALLLGRVSNLPTVWTNLLTGVVLAGGAPEPAVTVLLVLSLTLFYIGGMYLNDAFDAAIDARERPERPIPSGRVARSTVFVFGFGMLVIGVILLAITGHRSGTGWSPVMAGIGLAIAIVAYDMWHKSNPLSPVIMGLCRMLVYVTAAYCVTRQLPSEVLVGATVLLCYLIGLTYVAKQENIGAVKNMWPLVFLAAPVIYGVQAGMNQAPAWLFTAALAAWIGIALHFVRRRGPGDIPRAVVSLIAGMCVVDAILIASTGQAGLATLALAGFALTLALQRFVPGT